MFTGLIQEVGHIEAMEDMGDGKQFTIRCPDLFAEAASCADAIAVGESIAVDGICLTVTTMSVSSFVCLAGAETLDITTAGQWGIGSRVNLERSLRVGDRMGGHWVLGHVDVVATIAHIAIGESNTVFGIEIPPQYLRYVIVKGSVCIDGISLTVNRIDTCSVYVALIPHTLKNTTLGGKKQADRVNIEVDVLGKYVENMLGETGQGGLSNQQRQSATKGQIL